MNANRLAIYHRLGKIPVVAMHQFTTKKGGILSQGVLFPVAEIAVGEIVALPAVVP
jgi:hypothetical protein